MMFEYELIENETTSVVKRTNQNNEVAWIPTDPANSDYQAYLRWLEDPEAEETGTIS